MIGQTRNIVWRAIMASFFIIFSLTITIHSMGASVEDKSPAFKPAPLPYSQNALEPYISERTISFHYGKHHKGYADTLNRLVAGTRFSDKTLETIIVETANKEDQVEIFNNAAQVWNHDFFWAGMKKGGGGKPAGSILKMIEQSFGNFNQFRTQFKKAALSRFGSGYAWLVQDGNNLKIITTPNADTPIIHGFTPLMTCDVWEHAYYLDYQNKRGDFVELFLDHLVNWEFVASRVNK